MPQGDGGHDDQPDEDDGHVGDEDGTHQDTWMLQS